jgi:hypothetical protein
VGHVGRVGEKRNVCRLLVGKPNGKRRLARQRRRWVHCTNIDVVEIDWSGVDWIGVLRDRNRCRALVNSVMNFRVYKTIKLSSGYAIGSLSSSGHANTDSQSVS